MKFRYLNKVNGVSAKGKAWTKITLSSDLSDGSRRVADFFVNPDVSLKFSAIPFDSHVQVAVTLDEQLHFDISDVRVVSEK